MDVKDSAKGIRVRFADGGHEDFFMDINARADRVLDVRVKRSADATSIVQNKGLDLLRCISPFDTDVFALGFIYRNCHIEPSFINGRTG